MTATDLTPTEAEVVQRVVDRGQLYMACMSMAWTMTELAYLASCAKDMPRLTDIHAAITTAYQAVTGEQE